MRVLEEEDALLMPTGVLHTHRRLDTISLSCDKLTYTALRRCDFSASKMDQLRASNEIDFLQSTSTGHGATKDKAGTKAS